MSIASISLALLAFLAVKNATLQSSCEPDAPSIASVETVSRAAAIGQACHAVANDTLRTTLEGTMKQSNGNSRVT